MAHIFTVNPSREYCFQQFRSCNTCFSYFCHHQSSILRKKIQYSYIPWTLSGWVAVLHRTIRPSHHTTILASAIPLESPTSRHCFQYDEAPVSFRGMEYDETDKWLSPDVLQVMAVPTRSHLNSLQGCKQILWRFKGPHARRVPQREAIRVTTV
jgi:hypothetical protein